MILTIPINPEMRIRLAHAEAIKLDISGHPDLAELKADLVAAHAHIELLHSELQQLFSMGSGAIIPRAKIQLKLSLIVDSWEESQCQL